MWCGMRLGSSPDAGSREEARHPKDWSWDVSARAGERHPHGDNSAGARHQRLPRLGRPHPSPAKHWVRSSPRACGKHPLLTVQMQRPVPCRKQLCVGRCGSAWAAACRVVIPIGLIGRDTELFHE